MTHDPGHAPDREPPPPSIPDLDLVRRIGRGGFGEVWLGINRATGGLKAVKVVPLARGGRKVDPAGREVVSLAQFESQQIGRHPNLLDVQHVGRTDDVLFMLMDPADDVSGTGAAETDRGAVSAIASLLKDVGEYTNPAGTGCRQDREVSRKRCRFLDAPATHR